MKMILAIISADDAARATAALIEHGHRVTRVATEGGWLRRQNSTLLLGVDDDRVDDVVSVLTASTQKRTRVGASGTNTDAAPFSVESGGATMFVLAVENLQLL